MSTALPLGVALLRSAARLILPCALVAASSVSLAVTSLVDPVGDFLPTYLGNPATSAGLDVVSVGAVYNVVNNTFTLSSTLAGPVRTTDLSFYNWNVDTGGGILLFANLGITGVYTDGRLVMDFQAAGNGALVGTAAVLTDTGISFLPASSMTASGNSISVTFSASVFPSHGYAPNKYLWSMFTSTVPPGGILTIADFAPDNASFTAAAVPEPGSWALMLAGVAVIALRRRHAQPDTQRRAASQSC